MAQTHKLITIHGEVRLSKATVEGSRYEAILTPSGTKDKTLLGWVGRVIPSKGNTFWEPHLWFEDAFPLPTKDTQKLFGSKKATTLKNAGLALVRAWELLTGIEAFTDPKFMIEERPTRAEYIRYYAYRAGEVVLILVTYDEMCEFVWQFYDGCWDGEAPRAIMEEMGYLVEESFLQPEYEAAMESYNASDQRRVDLFRHVVYHNCRVEVVTPQVEKAFQVAWEFSECAKNRYEHAYNLFDRMVGLLREGNPHYGRSGKKSNRKS